MAVVDVMVIDPMLQNKRGDQPHPWARWFAAGTVTIALVALTGWMFGLPGLRGLSITGLQTNPITAVGLAMLGSSIWVSIHRSRTTVVPVLGYVLAGGGVFQLMHHLTGLGPSIDAWALRLVDAPVVPGAGVSVETAACFILLGGGVAFLDSKPDAARYPSQMLITAAGLLALYTFLGEVYGSDGWVNVVPTVPMSMTTALGFLLSSVAALLLRPARGYMSALATDHLSLTSVRHLLLAGTGLAVLGWLSILGQRLGLYDPELGTATMVFSSIVIFAGFVIWNASNLREAFGDVKRAHDVAKENAAQLAEANGQLESFSYFVSHDLRAPLRSIDGFSDILQRKHAERLDEEGHRLLTVVRGGAQRMNRLIDALLRFSQTASGDLRKTSVDMNAVVGSIVAESQEQMRNVVISIGTLPGVYGDASLLRQVWVNFIGNALKYSATATPPKIAIAGRRVGNEVEFTIQDNGVGFDMQFSAKLFQAFQRLHKNTEFDGSGIGLAMVQRIVQRHGGRVWANGIPNRGATFGFSLPIIETANRTPNSTPFDDSLTDRSRASLTG